MKHIRDHPHLWSIVSLLMIDSLFFGLTDPKNVPSWLLMVGFLLSLATLYQIVKGGLVALSWYGLPTRRHSRRLTMSITLVSAIFLALQSLGELGPRDIVVMLPFTWLTYLYFTYGRAKTQADANV